MVAAKAPDLDFAKLGYSSNNSGLLMFIVDISKWRFPNISLYIIIYLYIYGGFLYKDTPKWMVIMEHPSIKGWFGGTPMTSETKAKKATSTLTHPQPWGTQKDLTIRERPKPNTVDRLKTADEGGSAQPKPNSAAGSAQPEVVHILNPITCVDDIVPEKCMRLGWIWPFQEPNDWRYPPYIRPIF